jgi:hypothetical protein
VLLVDFQLLGCSYPKVNPKRKLQRMASVKSDNVVKFPAKSPEAKKLEETKNFGLFDKDGHLRPDQRDLILETIKDTLQDEEITDLVVYVKTKKDSTLINATNSMDELVGILSHRIPFIMLASEIGEHYDSDE